jgi:hypothetical protein
MHDFVRFDRINASCLLFPSSLHNQIIQINSFIFNVFYYASDFRVFLLRTAILQCASINLKNTFVRNLISSLRNRLTRLLNKGQF